MKLKTVIYLWVLSLSLILADDGFNIRYHAPIIPLEITVDKDGFDFSLTKEIMTPIGSFGLGYSAYKAEFEEEYTYVIIEDMNSRKEYIYKVKDKSTLRLVNKGTTSVEIKKNRVRIMIEKGSEFKLEFEVIENDSSSYRSSRSKWINVSASNCRANGGEMYNGACLSERSDAKNICRMTGGVLPTIDELEKVVTGCGGTMNGVYPSDWDKNKAICYKKKGFNSNIYWGLKSNNKIILFYGFDSDGGRFWNGDNSRYYIQCIKE